VITTLEIAHPSRGYWGESWKRLRKDRLGTAAAVLIVILALLALAAPLISAVVTHHAYQDQDLDLTFAPPGVPGYWLGADELGRDTLTRLIWGARVSLAVGAITVAVALTVGTAAGLAAAYYGELVDDVLMRIVDMILSIPPILLFILVGIVFAKQSGLLTLSLTIASVSWGNTARLVRGEALATRNRDFMLATRSLGASDLRLILVHLLPNVVAVLIVVASLDIGRVMLIEAALDFLGFGIHPPTPSWGNMLSNAQEYFAHSPWLVFFPGLCIFVTVLAFNLLGNAVRDAFDPRLK
jgi:ABC-type dipeptide/oligopeptide/nickel transport system permease subunit